MRDIRVPNQDFSLFTEKCNHLIRLSQLVMQLRMLKVHFLGAEETRRDSVVSVFQVLFLLVGSEEGPAKKTRAQLVGRVVVLLDSLDELGEFVAVPVHVPQLLLVCHLCLSSI
jgi:hypothetical protein